MNFAIFAIREGMLFMFNGSLETNVIVHFLFYLLFNLFQFPYQLFMLIEKVAFPYTLLKWVWI